MKKLLNTLYISNPDSYLSLDGENIVVKLKEEELGRVPLHNIESIVTMGFTGASPKLMGYCAEKNIGLTFLSGSGKFLTAICGESRAVLANRFVLTIINKRIVNESGFYAKENGAIIMDDETRKAVISAWQSKKQEQIVHPFLKEKVEWGMVPYTQALLLARYLRGDLDEYPPFLWK